MTKTPKSKQATMFDTLAKKTEKLSLPNNSSSSVVEIATDLKTGSPK